MFKPSKRLQNLYDRYNKEFFDGSLPSVHMGWDDAMAEDTLGKTIVVEDDETHQKVLVVTINPVLKKHWKEVMHMTVLHELAHCRLYPYMAHGKRFNNEMIRLAVRGAFNGLW